MKPDNIDMSPEAITNRLKTMEQLWELSVRLMGATPHENAPVDGRVDKPTDASTAIFEENY